LASVADTPVTVRDTCYCRFAHRFHKLVPSHRHNLGHIYTLVVSPRPAGISSGPRTQYQHTGLDKTTQIFQFTQTITLRQSWF